MAAELPQTPSTALNGHHHITMGVGDPQEDFDFHTRVLGLKCVKRTLFYDGATPIYHFYYQGWDIWGATARIVKQLLELVYDFKPQANLD